MILNFIDILMGIIFGLPPSMTEIEEGNIRILMLEYERYRKGEEVHYPFDIFQEDVDKEQILHDYLENTNKLFTDDECYSYYKTYNQLAVQALKYDGIDIQFNKLRELIEEVKFQKMIYFFKRVDKLHNDITSSLISTFNCYSSIKHMLISTREYCVKNLLP